MADSSYIGLVYSEAGPNGAQAYVVKTGGAIELPVTVMTTTSATITNFGITTFGTTIASAYTLAAPDRAGLRKVLMCTVHGASTVSQVITTSSANMLQDIFGGSTVGAAYQTMTFTEPTAVELVSLSTSVWGILNKGGSVAYTS